jgi:hypothetical protein
MDYFILAVQANIVYQRMEKSLLEIIQKTESRKKGRSNEHTQIITTLLDTLGEQSFVNPLDSAPPDAPTFQELQHTQQKTNAIPPSMEKLQKLQEDQGYQKISNIFTETADPMKLAYMAFCTFIAGRGKVEPTHLNKSTVHEAVLLLSNAQEVLSSFFSYQVMLALDSTYISSWNAYSRKELESFCAANPSFPVALSFALFAFEGARMIPTSFNSFIDSNAIPGLEKTPAENVKLFYKGTFLSVQDDIGRHLSQGTDPYMLAERSYASDGAFSLLTELATKTTAEDSKQTYEEFYYLGRRLTNFLDRRGALLIPKEGDDPRLIVENRSGLVTIFAIAEDKRCLALQLKPRKNTIQVTGIPGNYVNESQDVVVRMLKRVLAAAKQQKYREYTDRFEYRGIQEFRNRLEAQENTPETTNHQETISPIVVAPLQQYPEMPKPERKRRFSIEIPENLLDAYQPFVRKAILEEIDEVNFSKPGSHPMAPVIDKPNQFRMKIWRILRDENDKKVKVNLRALVELHGSSGQVLHIFDRPEGYERQFRNLRI